ncbi:Non-histone chromosomal protein 6B [Madurella fahalii]|uniref:Non-histone chromosomal protein 6B n=1 Tax=Madurella fahalii TaxID=1157608 RepID=A0ABQ0FYD0_9PEZI
MTRPLETIFGELGISQYLDAFLEQGFDTWETILDITESDLDALGVKLGHRRKLQRQIANSRGVAPDASLTSPTQPSIEELRLQDPCRADPPKLEGRETVGVIITKRKYRRHPKPDENAPERPPSAYVLFSNKMREDLKGRNLTFTEIAKLVGENWQNLSPAEKEPFESQAQAIKDKYLSDLAEYKKTPEYRKYMAYLQEFKAKHAPSQDKDASKRVRLSDSGSQSRSSPSATPTRTSRSGSGSESRKGSEPPAGRQQRLGSSVSMTESQNSASAAPSMSTASPVVSMDSPAISSGDHSPTFGANLRDLPPLSGPASANQGDDRATEQFSTQMHLPSLSDVFDGQNRLRGGVTQSCEANGFHFPGVDARPATFKGEQTSSRSSSSNASFGRSRTPADGPLPIRALLESRPEPTFEASQPPHPLHSSSFHLEQKLLHAHQAQTGATALPAINGFHAGPSLPHAPLSSHSISSAFYPPATSSPIRLPHQGKHNASLDGMSALLKAGEIVDRRAH